MQVIEMENKDLEHNLYKSENESKTWKEKVDRAKVQLFKQKKANKIKQIAESSNLFTKNGMDLKNYVLVSEQAPSKENIEILNKKSNVQVELQCEEQLSRTLEGIL